MSGPAFGVTKIEQVNLSGPPDLMACDPMSAFVWPCDEKRHAMLVRAVPRDGHNTGMIWHARGHGLTFQADPVPLLTPGPEALDLAGCEDPTVVHHAGTCMVYYTGLRSDGVAQLLYAEGPDIGLLSKRGVAHASTKTDRNTKEAAVDLLDDQWLLLFEYSRGGRSRIGRAIADGPAGPWRDEIAPFKARPGKWDGHHLSTGPLIVDNPEGPLMFYNGSDSTPNWSIGWVVLDPTCSEVRARGDEPLIPPPATSDLLGRHISFASSAVPIEGGFWLYFSRNDNSLFRATVKRR